MRQTFRIRANAGLSGATVFMRLVNFQEADPLAPPGPEGRFNLLEAGVTVDVVIPTYFETVRLFRAVESALNQTHKVHKVIVVDDGSSIEVRNEIANRFSRDPRVDLVFSDHLGHPGKVRNVGIQNSTSDWVAMLDADDHWEAEKLSKQLELATISNSDLVYTNSIYVHEDSSERTQHDVPLPLKLTPWKLVLSNHVVNSSVLVKRSVLNRVGNFVESPSVLGVEDYSTWLRISLTSKLAGLDEPLVYYTVSTSSLSRRNEGRTRLDALSNFSFWVERQSPRSALNMSVGIFTRIVILKESMSKLIRSRLRGEVKDYGTSGI